MQTTPATAVGPEAVTRSRAELRSWGDFVLLSLLWGSSYLFIKVALNEGLAPFTLVGIRLAIAAGFLLVVVRWRGGSLPRGRGPLLVFLVLGAVNVAIPWLLITWGTQWIPSGLSSILAALTPLFTIVVASLVLHDEPITVNRAAGLAIGFCGAVVLASPHLGTGGGSGDGTLELLGELAVIVAALCYAVGVVYARSRVTGRPLIRQPGQGMRAPDALEIALGQVLGALLVVAPLAIVADVTGGGPWLPQTLPAWFSVAWLGILGSGVAFILAFRIIERWGATRMTLVTYCIPVVAIVLGVVVLGERLDGVELLGTAMILSGVVLTSSSRGQRRLFGRSAA